jgi:hypothetical protein
VGDGSLHGINAGREVLRFAVQGEHAVPACQKPHICFEDLLNGIGERQFFREHLDSRALDQDFDLCPVGRGGTSVGGAVQHPKE